MSEQLLRACNVSKRFGGLSAVNDVGLEVQTGVIHALIGPNGSGKTTFLNLVSGIYRLDGGQIELGGRVLNGLSAHRIAQLGIGRTFQNIRLFQHLTVLENVMVGQHYQNHSGLLATIFATSGARESENLFREKAMAALALLGLEDTAGLPATSLPYGKQRMVEIARTLVMEPRLLLLDEPAAGLNPTETVELMGRIQSINGRCITVLLVEHNMRLVMSIANRITVLDFGRKIAEGTPLEIQNDPRVIEAYLGSEADLVLDEQCAEVQP